MSRVLDVYLHDILAGKLVQTNDGRLKFSYDENYLTHRDHSAISLSLPLRAAFYEEKAVRAFFSGLLPDDIGRHKLARYLGISEKNPFALLEVVGGECAGALSFYHEGEKPPSPRHEDMEVLDENHLKEILDLLKRRPLLAGGDNIRLSLAGAQDKLAVGMAEGQIALVKGSTPTSHILKPMIEDIRDSVHNEYFCLRLAHKLNIQVPHAELRWAGNTPYLLVERYDRYQEYENHLMRLHQEDFCQAMGIPPELKYEREGGPSITQSLALLQNHTLQPAADYMAFLERIIFNYVIGNADAHGKNHSLLYMKKIPTLAPAYDIMCTAVYPQLSPKMAMKIGGKYNPEDVYIRHWYQIVQNTEPSKKMLTRELLSIAKGCIAHLHPLQEELKHEGVVSPLFDAISYIIKKRAERLLALS